MKIDESSSRTLNGVASAENEATAEQEKMDLLIAYLLLGGVALSLTLIAGGLLWRWMRTGRSWVEYQLVAPNVFELARQEIRMAMRGQIRPRLLDTSGVVVLMLTPYLRVMASVVYFLAVLRNWKYTVFTSIVLIVLTYSLFLK